MEESNRIENVSDERDNVGGSVVKLRDSCIVH